MEPFKVHVLGCGSAKPTVRHYASSQVVEIRGRVMMIDCGEGTQVQLRRSHVRFSKMSDIFISHLHGDHCFGLIGLICSFGLSGRTAPLRVHAHEDLQPMLEQMLHMWATDLGFEVVIYEDKSIIVSTIPLEHRVPCCGFLFTEKPALPHIRRDMLDFYHIPVSQIMNIKNGAGWVTEDGEQIAHEQLVIAADPVRSYAYCSDTRYIPTLHQLIQGVNLLYHESTYDETLKPQAAKYAHSTAAEAATVARDAHARQLMLGHYSARYDDESVLLHEAESIFPHVILANEGLVVDVI